MAALLMPGRTFKDVAFDQMTKLGLSSLSSGPAVAGTLAAAIADVFQVSKQAALIRLGTLQVVQASYAPSGTPPGRSGPSGSLADGPR